MKSRRTHFFPAPALPGFLSVFLVFIALALLPAACARRSESRARIPRPTVNRLDEGAESRNRDARREYFERMHRAAPGVDWRAVERRNGLAAMERRRRAVLEPRATLGPGEWLELGSRNQAGRMHCAAWSPDKQVLYAGSDRGGLWMGDRDGNGWTPLGDNLYGGVHEIGVVPGGPGRPDILIRLYGDMVHRTVDMGLTWTEPAGLGGISEAKRIVVLDDADHTVFIVANRWTTWKLFVSTDKGASFSGRYSFHGSGDIWTPRDAAGPLYLVDQGQVKETADGGLTFTDVGNPMPVTGKAILAGSEAPSLGFDVAVKAGGVWQLWRSTDAGQSWTYLRDLDDFWESLVASTQDGDLIAYAGVEMRCSRDGGATWKKVNRWGDYYGDPAHKLHADIPGLYVFPDAAAPQGEIWYIGTDGGLYDSDDRVQSVRNLSLSGLGVSQYYSVLTSRRNPNLVLAGSQDQGYQRAVLQWPHPPPPGPWADFDQMISGDYGHLTSSNGAHDLVYSVYPGFVLVQEGEEHPNLLYPWIDFPPGESYLWMPYIQADPTDPASFYFCARKLYRYTRVSGATWSCVQHSSRDFGPGYLTAIAFSPLDPQRAFAATGDGRLFHSDDGAVTWTESSDTGPGSHYFYGTVLLPSSTDEDVCWVGGSGYSTAPVKRTGDGGVTWSAERNGLPDTLVYCMAEAPDESGAVFCGSENGAWVYDPATRTWIDLLGADAPINTYWACEAVPSENLVRFGTYGRGIWDYRLNTPGYFPYGELLDPPNVLVLKNGAQPLIGQPTTFVVAGCRPWAAGALALGAASAQGSILGGTLLVALPAIRKYSFMAGGNGEAAVTVRIPNNPGLIGKEYFLQAAALDSSQVQGWALSNGLRAVIGG